MRSRKPTILRDVPDESTSIDRAMLTSLTEEYARAVGGDDERSRRFVDAIERWMRGETQSGVFGFERVCLAAGVRSNRLRRRLQALRARTAAARWPPRATG